MSVMEGKRVCCDGADDNRLVLRASTLGVVEDPRDYSHCCQPYVCQCDGKQACQRLDEEMLGVGLELVGPRTQLPSQEACECDGGRVCLL